MGAESKPEDNPDFDDLVLDDALYNELGLSAEELEEQRELTEAQLQDPEGFNLDSGADAVFGEKTHEDRLRMLDDNVYGPEALVLAGFRPEEAVIARTVLDSAGGGVVKVLLCTDDVLYGTVDEAIWSAEVDWAQPRPASWNAASAWGSQKAVLFSGMSVGAQATVLELLDGAGLLHICACMALEDEASRRVGDVLADAVKDQRKMSSTHASKDVFNAVQGRMVSQRAGFDNLEELLGAKARKRLQEASPADRFEDGGDDSGRTLSEAELDELFDRISLAPEESDMKQQHASDGGQGSGSGLASIPASAHIQDSVSLMDASANSPSELNSSLSSPEMDGVCLASSYQVAGGDNLDSDLESMAGFENVLDDLLPEANDLLDAKSAEPMTTASKTPIPPNAHNGSMLSRVQEAVRAGADAETLASLISSFSSQSSPRPATSPTASESSLSRPAKPQALSKSSEPLGPAPPPGLQVDPLLKLKPEVRRALQGKNVRFVDLSKLPKKFRQQIAGQVQRQPGQQMLNEDLQQGLQGAVDHGSGNPEGAKLFRTSEEDVTLSGHEHVFQDMPESSLQKQEDSHDRLSRRMDEAAVLRLVEAAAASGLDPQRALAEAMAMGISVPETAVRLVGLQLPDPSLVQEIRALYTSDTDDETTVASDKSDIQQLDGSRNPALKFGTDSAADWGEKWLSGTSDQLAGLEQGKPSNNSSPRRWGDSLTKTAKKTA